MARDIDEALRQLERNPTPVAVRFDDGAPLAGTVAVLPAAFNPPTRAHVHLLERAGRKVGTRQSLALLTTRNVDKGLYGAPLPDRVGMLLAARDESGDFAVGASNQARILDQAHALAIAFPRATFEFVVGFDTLERLFAPRYYSDMEGELRPFFERHRVLAANRGETTALEVAQWIDQNTGPFAPRVAVLEIDERPASLSSTRARETAGSPAADEVVPPAVKRYIAAHRLYR